MIPGASRVVLPDGSVTWTVLGSDGLPFEEAEVFLEHHRTYGSPNTVKQYAISLGQWLRYLHVAGSSWQQADRTSFAGFVRHLRTGEAPGVVPLSSSPQLRSDATIAVRLAAVIAFYRYQVETSGAQQSWLNSSTSGHPSQTPSFKAFLHHASRTQRPRMARLNIRRAHRDRPPILTPEECGRIFDACATYSPATGWQGSIRDRFLFELLCETGMRLGEALSLQHGDLHLGLGGTPSVQIIPRPTPHGVRVKGGGSRRIYVSSRLENLYSDYVWSLCDQGWDREVKDPDRAWLFVNVRAEPLFEPLKPTTVYDVVSRVKRQTKGLVHDRWTPHWFRHTHATALLLSGQPEILVSRRLGHAQIQTTLNLYGWVTRDAELEALADWRSFTTNWVRTPNTGLEANDVDGS